MVQGNEYSVNEISRAETDIITPEKTVEKSITQSHLLGGISKQKMGNLVRTLRGRILDLKLFIDMTKTKPE